MTHINFINIINSLPKQNVKQALVQQENPEVCSVAVIKDNKILMGRRVDSGRWTLPGGHSNFGETPNQAVIRETKEETGLDLQNLHYLASEMVQTAKGPKTVHAYAAVMDFPIEGLEYSPNEEVTDWEWVDITNGLPEEIKNFMHHKRCLACASLGLIP